MKHTNDGKKGGLLKGKPHYDKGGKPLGGIKAIVTDTNQPVELEGGEVIINKEASKKHWKELSRINQSAGGGVPILPPDGVDEDVDENDFAKGGKVIEFNRNHTPKSSLISYARKIKEKYPKVWDMGGNIFGNEAFKNLERVAKRGYWMDGEAWMYKKWQAFNARHSGDFRIAGVIANLKWANVVDKGLPYMKELIQQEIDKKYPSKKSMARGGAITYKEKYNQKYGYDKAESHSLKEISKDTGKSVKGLQQIYNKGVGAFKTNPESVRPQVKSKEQWAMGRVYSAVMGGKAARVDAKELKMAMGGVTGYGGLTPVAEKNGQTISFYDSQKNKVGYFDFAFDKSAFSEFLDPRNSEFYLDVIEVFPAFQGKGYSHEMLQYAKGLATGLGATIITLRVEDSVCNRLRGKKTEPSRVEKLYLKHGFQYSFTDQEIMENDEKGPCAMHLQIKSLPDHKKLGGKLTGRNIELMEVEYRISQKKIANTGQKNKNKTFTVYTLRDGKKDLLSISSDWIALNTSNRRFSGKSPLYSPKLRGALQFFKKYGYDLPLDLNKNYGDTFTELKIADGFTYTKRTVRGGISEFYEVQKPFIDDEIMQAFKSNKMVYGGELKKGIREEKEHISTAKKLYNREITPAQAPENIAREHLSENPNYYTELMAAMQKKDKGGSISEVKFGLKTPTGKPSKLTFMQQVLVRTKAFKAWFGDWEAAGKELAPKEKTNETLWSTYKGVSKVIDGDTLEPRLVYHGTPERNEFYTFDFQQRRPYAYFAFNEEYSQLFAQRDGRENAKWDGIYDVFLRVKNPFTAVGKDFVDVKKDGTDWGIKISGRIVSEKLSNGDLDPTDEDKKIEVFNEIMTELMPHLFFVSKVNKMRSGENKFVFWKIMSSDKYQIFKSLLMKHGYDGVIYTEECCEDYDVNDPQQFTRAVTIFEENQVKLADGRNAYFSAESSDIRFEAGGEVSSINYHDAIFGSEMEVQEEIMPRKKSNREYLNEIFNKIKTNDTTN